MVNCGADVFSKVCSAFLIFQAGEIFHNFPGGSQWKIDIRAENC